MRVVRIIAEETSIDTSKKKILLCTLKKNEYHNGSTPPMEFLSSSKQNNLRHNIGPLLGFHYLLELMVIFLILSVNRLILPVSNDGV